MTAASLAEKKRRAAEEAAEHQTQQERACEIYLSSKVCSA